MNIKNGSDIPLGLGMALMQNPEAYTVFAGLDAQKQQKVIDGTHRIKTKNEMKNYVAGIPTMF